MVSLHFTFPKGRAHLPAGAQHFSTARNQLEADLIAKVAAGWGLRLIIHCSRLDGQKGKFECALLSHHLASGRQKHPKTRHHGRMW